MNVCACVCVCVYMYVCVSVCACVCTSEGGRAGCDSLCMRGQSVSHSRSLFPVPIPDPRVLSDAGRGSRS